MQIEIKQYIGFNEHEILNLYKTAGWSNYYNKSEMLINAFGNSLFILGAYDGCELVGIIRVVGDGHSIVHIQDIIVLPSHQRQKIGTELLSSILEKYKDVYQITLLTDNTEKTKKFYESLKFKDLADINCLAFQYFK